MILHLCHHWFWITVLSVLLAMAVIVRGQDPTPAPEPGHTNTSHPLPPPSKLKAVLFNVTRLYPVPDVPDRNPSPQQSSPPPDRSSGTKEVVGSGETDPTMSSRRVPTSEKKQDVGSGRTDPGQVSPVVERQTGIIDEETHLSHLIFDVSEAWPHAESHDEHLIVDPAGHWDTLDRVDRTLSRQNGPEAVERRDIPSQPSDGDKPFSDSYQSPSSEQSDQPFSTSASRERSNSTSDSDPFPSIEQSSSISKSDQSLSRITLSDKSSSSSDNDQPPPSEQVSSIQSSTVPVTSDATQLLTDSDSSLVNVNQSERLEREIRNNVTQTQTETHPGFEPGSGGLKLGQQTQEVVRKISTTVAPAHLNDSTNEDDHKERDPDDIKYETEEGGYTIYVTPPSPHNSTPNDLTTPTRPTPSTPVEVVKKSENVSKIRDKSVVVKAKFSSKTKDRTPLKPVIVVESSTSAVSTVAPFTTGSSVSSPAPRTDLIRTNATSKPADYEVMNDSPVTTENVTDLAVENTSISTDYEELNHTAPVPVSANLSSARISAHGRMLDVTPQAHGEAPSHAWEAHAAEVNVALISGISFGALALVTLLGAVSFIMYRRYRWNKPQTLSDKCSNPDSSGYIDDSTLRENSEEMYSLDNDSFLNSLEAMTIQNYWTDHVKHTKL